MKAYKVTVSGDYATEDYKRKDFQDIVGIIPMVETDLAEQAIRVRYIPMWIAQDERYTDRVKKIRGCFVDSMEEAEHKFSFVGKNIKEMSYEEIQDLATAYQLRRVPLYKKSSLAETRRIAYVEYSNKVNHTKYDEKKDNFDYAKAPPLVVADEIRNDRIMAKTNEEVINEEMSHKSALTLDDLKNILTERGVQFDKRLGYDKLYALAFQD